MEPGQRALGFAFERDSAGTIAPPFLHFGGWYSAVKRGVTDPNGAATMAAPVFYRPEKRPVARPFSFEWIPGLFDWPLFHGERYHATSSPKRRLTTARGCSATRPATRGCCCTSITGGCKKRSRCVPQRHHPLQPQHIPPHPRPCRRRRALPDGLASTLRSRAQQQATSFGAAIDKNCHRSACDAVPIGPELHASARIVRKPT